MKRLLLIPVGLLLLYGILGAQEMKTETRIPAESAGLEKAVLAGGCFWCMEHPFEKLAGVHSVVSGYTGGPEKNPTYKQVASGRTGHTEAVEISFDPDVISYEEILEVYWQQIDPTSPNGQFVDRGSQYRPEIFVLNSQQREIAEASKKRLMDSGRFEKPILVPVTDGTVFYPAEDYHQDYYKKNPVRYKFYRYGSGRDQFLDKYWGPDRKG